MPFDLSAVERQRPSNPLHYFPVIGSTMTEAAQLAMAGAPHGTVILADEQTAGIGRLGRSWISEPEVGIYCSVLLRLSLPPARLPLASLMVGLAVREAIQEAGALTCDLRWPNDVLIGERKVAGILPQLLDSCIIAGIGINVNNTRFPGDLRTPATSLRLASNGHPQSREHLLARLLAALDVFSDLLVTRGADAILRAFTAASSYALDRRVVVEENGLEGITSGLDENGFLLVRSDAGKLFRVSSGGVRPHTGAAL